jgi:hypothetical protein
LLKARKFRLKFRNHLTNIHDYSFFASRSTQILGTAIADKITSTSATAEP